MNNRQPFGEEANLKFVEWQREAQRYSHDLTQKLTFFVIGIELVFCGYVLLHAEKFGGVKYSSLLFLLAGCSALFGLLWRFSTTGGCTKAHITQMPNPRSLKFLALRLPITGILYSQSFFLYSHSMRSIAICGV
jgi:hypothetical protein